MNINDDLLLKRASAYMESLSAGIDPLSGELLVDDSVVNNEKMRRCFSFVHDVLSKLIDAGGLNALSANSLQADNKPALAPFSLPAAERAKIMLNAKPIDISELTKTINNRINADSTQKLKGAAFGTWLLKNGFLEKQGSFRRPSAKGQALGISARTKETTQLIYSMEAQRFLLRKCLKLKLTTRKRNAINRG